MSSRHWAHALGPLRRPMRRRHRRAPFRRGGTSLGSANTSLSLSMGASQGGFTRRSSLRSSTSFGLDSTCLTIVSRESLSSSLCYPPKPTTIPPISGSGRTSQWCFRMTMGLCIGCVVACSAWCMSLVVNAPCGADQFLSPTRSAQKSRSTQSGTRDGEVA